MFLHVTCDILLNEISSENPNMNKYEAFYLVILRGSDWSMQNQTTCLKMGISCLKHNLFISICSIWHEKIIPILYGDSIEFRKQFYI